MPHKALNKRSSHLFTAIGKNQLPLSATNLIVEHPRTSKFYLLPKMHKPGNPGRPIVSACSCPTELLALYLDHITAPFVRSLDSYVKDTTHMLNILDSFRFRDVDRQRLIITMDIKSLYTVIPNEGGLRALQYYLDKREILEPPTDTLLRMAELVLTLNTFEFSGEYYKQTGGVTMGSRLGPNYACLFVGHEEERILSSYTGIKPDLYKQYMDDVAGAASCSEEDLRQFLEFASSFHPNLEYTWSVSTDKLPLLDIYMKPQANRIATSIYYKATDSHSYLNFSSSHPYSCKSSIPYSQFLRPRQICSNDADFDIEAAKMETFFAARGYPNDIIRRGRERASTKSRAEILKSDAANNIAKDRVPFVTTFHPSNLVVEKIISRNFRILREDSRTSKIFNKPPLKAFRRAKNLKDLLVRNSLPRNLPHQSPGTFPCNRTVCRTCPHVNSSSTIETPKGHVYITGHFSCITEHVVYCLSCTKCPSIVYIGETGRRLADRFREHRRDIINGRNDLPVPAHFNQPNHTLEDMKVAVLKAGLANQEYRKKQEMRLIFKYGTVSPRGLNQDFSFT